QTTTIWIYINISDALVEWQRRGSSALFLVVSLGLLLGAVGIMVGGLQIGLRSTVHDDAQSEKKSMNPAPPRRHWAVSKLILVILTLVFAGICLVGKSAIDIHFYGVSETDPEIAEKPNFSWSQVRNLRYPG